MTTSRLPFSRLGDRLLVTVSPLLLLAAWVWACQRGWFPQQILVHPAIILETGIDLWASDELQHHLQQSLSRLLLGFTIGSLAGVAFGVAVGHYKALQELFGPFFNALRQVPTVAFIPMLILIFGVEETFKIIVVAKAAFFTVALATLDAVKGIPRTYLEVAKAYRLPVHTLMRQIVLPATVPPVLTGLRLALGRSWMVLVAAELLASDSGIGQMMELGRQMFRIDIVMLGVVITGVIGFTMDRGLRALEGRMVRWRGA